MDRTSGNGNTHDEVRAEESGRTLKAYRTPSLRSLGTLRDLTLSFTGEGSGGGSRRKPHG